MKKKFFSLQYKFLIYFLLLSIFSSVVTGYFCYRQTSRVIVQKANQLYQQRTDAITSNIEAIMQQVNQVSHLILQDSSIRSYLYGTDIGKEEREITRFLLPFTDYKGRIYSICIQGNGDNSLSINRGYELPVAEREMLDYADELHGGYFWKRQVIDGSAHNRPSVPVFTFLRQYRDMYNLTNHIGYIRIDVREDDFTKLCADQSKEGSVFLIADADAVVCFSTAPDYLGMQLTPSFTEKSPLNNNPKTITELGTIQLDQEYLMVAHPLKSIHGTVINLVPLQTVIRDNMVVAQVILSVVAINIIICVMLASFISKSKLAPLRTLSQLISEAKQQNFKEYIGETNNDEIGILASEFNNMSQHLELMVNRVYAAQLRQNEAEFSALQAQINPHFLYNTLDTIYWIAKLENANESAELVRILGDLFRLSLNKGSGITTVENEVNHLSSYLLIQRKRHQDSVTLSLEVEPDTMKAKTIKLVLQPLVENAFIHGVEKKQAKGAIRVIVRRSAENLVYEIHDDGVGMSKEEIEQIVQNHGNSGLGIKNVNERIKLLFGSGYGVFVESSPGSGTKITVIQPFTTDVPKSEEAAQ